MASPSEILTLETERAKAERAWKRAKKAAEKASIRFGKACVALGQAKSKELAWL